MNFKKITAFSFYDFGNSVFPMIVVTALTSSYFVNHIVDNQQTGTALWQLTIGIAGIFIAILMPFMGNVADSQVNGRIKFLRVFSLLTVLSIALFYFVLPSNGYVLIALIILFVGSVSYEASNSLYNSSMKNCNENDLTLTSGIGFASGFLGGVIMLSFLLYFLILPDQNIFGVSKIDHLNIRFSHLILAFWFLIFCLPLLYFCKIDQQNSSLKSKTTSKIKDLIWRGNLTNIGKFLLARMLYMDGMIIISTTMGIFGTSVMGLSIGKILLVGILANISGAIACYLFGKFFKDDKKNIIITLFALSLVVFLISINKNSNLFLLLVVIGTFFAGPLQSSSRVVMAELTDDRDQGFGFGMFTFAGKATAVIGPICAAVLTYFISQRVGLAFSIILLLSGAFIMLKVSYSNQN